MKQVTIYGIIIIAALTAFLPRTSFTVKGKVTDSTGAILSAVSVTEKGTANITQTDTNGNFTITVADVNAILVFSSVGFDTREIKVSGKSMLHVQLSGSAANLEEVVVTAYSAVKKKSITGAAMQESEADMMLQGKVAGVAIRGNASYPSAAARKTRNQNYPLYQQRDEDFNTEGYDGITENRFLTVKDNPLSTFSIDVDAASYSNVRRYLNNGQLPPAGAVRTEELINYFHYDYPQPTGDRPFSIYTELSEAPWNKDHRLVLVSLQGKKVATENIPASNLVFLIDVSGSMEDANKLPLVKQSMKLLTDQLREKDKVAIVVYAGSAGLVLPATSGANTQTIKDAIERLTAGGSTAGGEGIKLAYSIARQNFVQGGNNRVILCTDGDFNVGASSDADMEKLIEQERKSGVFLTVLGYGMGNYKDNKMQKLAGKGNGNHAYIDDMSEAKKVLVSEFGGTLFTIAKDVKLQVEFNPAKVQAYRLIGYENRLLNKEDFNNDKKDAGELGSGHTVTALYEVIPAGVKSDFTEKVDPLKYQSLKNNAGNNNSPELMTIKFRYKDPDGEKSKLIEHPVVDGHMALIHTSVNFRFAAAVAQFGMLLTHSEFMQQSSYNNVLALANSAIGADQEGYRKGFLELVRKAGSLAKKENGVKEEDELVGRK
ncbi:von Willebrand factor type A domain-containing protein [Agriterribacter sp.]|uniref:vWA domain-containing protein n=1 Tax=Agriterribacter sp. TaxID=2821509 RepID=UPI002CA1E0E9|nr:von Willebrand factor type A domain-containing protein [Agriterribacter sp.]HRO48357.1 von Willebrand factor type A domain-containing protein [Agriterribacter sp.]HRQ19564.1 von Willebrand factor type A domain-containing protein [Agriterribacter sp.]